MMNRDNCFLLINRQPDKPRLTISLNMVNYICITIQMSFYQTKISMQMQVYCKLIKSKFTSCFYSWTYISIFLSWQTRLNIIYFTNNVARYSVNIYYALQLQYRALRAFLTICKLEMKYKL